MKKIILLLIFNFQFSIFNFSQIYIAKTCEISFFSEAPLENIEAVNKAAKPVLNTVTGDIQVKIPMKGFLFEKPLMQEHFNENYIETDKEGPKDAKGKPTYPNRDAVFRGKINEAIDYTKDGDHQVTVTGKMTIHGVEKERTLDGTLSVKNGQIMIHSTFTVHIADHHITVPSLSVKKIAEDVVVKLNATLEPFKK